MSFEQRIDEYTERVQRKLDASLPSESESPELLHEAMRYAVFNGGKRIRPLLVYAAGECVGAPLDHLDAPAAAIEYIHAFSLVHDDLPAMDDDDLRRGKPTVHRQFDEATAILAADALQPLAFALLADASAVDAEIRCALVRLLAESAGSIGMTGGQAIDLDAEGRSLGPEQIEHMYALKTGALIYASVMSACLLAPDLAADRAAALDAFARSIGVAFQIKDDLLDVEGETEIIGKPAGSDEALAKSTYPAALGIEASRARCDELLAAGLARLDVFGESADSLRWLARYIVERGK
ncbi:MAG: polyprenyl synthetase family protein [Woeseiaceae bacterium]|nr:polyprenyl synthetase family protein [Woeseiaceae bacterium]